MRLIVAQPPNRDQLFLFTPAWFDLNRPLASGYLRLKFVAGGYEVILSNGDILRTGDNTLSLGVEDITTADGNTIFASSTDDYLDIVIDQNQAVGMIASGADGDAYHIVDSADLLQDHICHGGCEFFAAWVWLDGLRVDMSEARRIHMTTIRSMRDEKLKTLDVPFMRAVETGSTVEQQRISVEKQVLRDIPQNFDLEQYTTPETLKAAIPTELTDK